MFAFTFAAAVVVGQFGGGVVGLPGKRPMPVFTPGASQEAPREIYSPTGTTIVPGQPTGTAPRLYGHNYERRFYPNGRGPAPVVPEYQPSLSSAKARAAAKRAAWRRWNAGY